MKREKINQPISSSSQHIKQTQSLKKLLNNYHQNLAKNKNQLMMNIWKNKNIQVLLKIGIKIIKKNQQMIDIDQNDNGIDEQMKRWQSLLEKDRLRF